MIYLGDHDPSGIDMGRDVRDRLELMAYEEVEVVRLALNMDQIQQYNPPPNPTKFTDSRSVGYIDQYGLESWELDALEPQVLERLVSGAIAQFLDRDKYDAVVEQEGADKSEYPQGGRRPGNREQGERQTMRQAIAGTAGATLRAPGASTCHRCGGRVMQAAEPSCLACGWVDYLDLDGNTSIMRLRYAGDSPEMGNTVVVCQFRPAARAAEMLRPRCPWCDVWMTVDASPSGVIGRTKASGWRCAQNHRLEVTLAGWR